MALQIINTGTRANDGLGDSLRTAFTKAEANFTELFANAGLTADTTVTFNSAMTTAEMQALIDAQPKNLNGNILTFQFEDGTYSLSAALVFRYFVGGLLAIQGNAADNTLSGTKAVNILGAYTAYGLAVESCGAVRIRYLRVSVGDSDGSVAPLAIRVYNCGYVNVHHVATTTQTGTSGIGKGYGIFFHQTHGEVWESHYSFMEAALTCQQGHLSSITQGTSNAATYGLLCLGGIICASGTQPTAGTAQFILHGGQIFT
jgi:hypothetical protein